MHWYVITVAQLHILVFNYQMTLIAISPDCIHGNKINHQPFTHPSIFYANIRVQFLYLLALAIPLFCNKVSAPVGKEIKKVQLHPKFQVGFGSMLEVDVRIIKYYITQVVSEGEWLSIFSSVLYSIISSNVRLFKNELYKNRNQMPMFLVLMTTTFFHK